MRKIIRFVKEARTELGKVVWPTRARTARLTVIVIVTTAVFGAFLAGVDYGLSKGIKYIITSTEKKSAPAPAGSTEQTVPVNGNAGTVQIPAGTTNQQLPQ